MDDDFTETFSLKTEPDSDNESIGFHQEENNRSDTVTWTQLKTRQLISLYKQTPELWDSKNCKSSKATREAKMELLAIAFNTTAEEVGRKIHNLRTQFAHQLRKIKRKMQQDNGGLVTVAWEYFEDLSFLAPSSISDAIEHSEGVNVELAEFQAKEEAQFGAAARANASLQSPGSSRQEAGDVDKFDQRDITRGTTKSTVPKTSDVAPSTRKSFGSRVAASAPPPLPPSANPMLWPEEPVPRIRPSINADECQIFGDFVASELRTLRSDESRKKLKRMIQKAILQVGEDEDVNIISCG